MSTNLGPPLFPQSVANNLAPVRELAGDKPRG